MTGECKRGINRGAWIAVAIMTLVVGMYLLAESVGADEPSDTERAVIECGETESMHGGSADNPPECADDTSVSAETDSECVTYERIATTTHRINGMVVAEYQTPQNVQICYSLESVSGESTTDYGEWQAEVGK